jgi:hypothetical protein
MYGKVKRKVTRIAPRRVVAPISSKEQAAKDLAAQRELRKTPAEAARDAAAAAEEAKADAKKEKRREAAAKRKAEKEKKAKKKPAKKAKKKVAKKAKKAVKKVAKAAKKPAKKAKKKATKKRIKWSEDMTQKELYAIAKKHGLKVLSKDWKSEIIRELKKATK